MAEETKGVEKVEINNSRVKMKNEIRSTTYQQIYDTSVKEKLVYSLHTSPSSTKDVKDKSPNFKLTNETQLCLWRDVTEHEVFGIGVIKKLERMDATQAIYAQKLITEILDHGLLKQLTPTTNIWNYNQSDSLILTPYSITLSSTTASPSSISKQ